MFSRICHSDLLFEPTLPNYELFQDDMQTNLLTIFVRGLILFSSLWYMASANIQVENVSFFFVHKVFLGIDIPVVTYFLTPHDPVKTHQDFIQTNILTKFVKNLDQNCSLWIVFKQNCQCQLTDKRRRGIWKD